MAIDFLGQLPRLAFLGEPLHVQSHPGQDNFIGPPFPIPGTQCFQCVRDQFGYHRVVDSPVEHAADGGHEEEK